MRAALHHRDRDTVEPADDQRAGVADGGRARPPRDVGVRDLGRLGNRVRERAETAAEDDPDRRLERDPCADRRNRLAEEVAQTVPSSRREGILVTIRSTASPGSSVT
jgi:hypothetical protein